MWKPPPEEVVTPEEMVHSPESSLNSVHSPESSLNSFQSSEAVSPPIQLLRSIETRINSKADGYTVLRAKVDQRKVNARPIGAIIVLWI